MFKKKYCSVIIRISLLGNLLKVERVAIKTHSMKKNDAMISIDKKSNVGKKSERKGILKENLKQAFHLLWLGCYCLC